MYTCSKTFRNVTLAATDADLLGNSRDADPDPYLKNVGSGYGLFFGSRNRIFIFFLFESRQRFSVNSTRIRNPKEKKGKINKSKIDYIVYFNFHLNFFFLMGYCSYFLYNKMCHRGGKNNIKKRIFYF